ncbi:Uncharacterised protein [Bordetella pertussis]|nr:Uncharacterised protein [Bordetella pertussis]
MVRQPTRTCPCSSPRPCRLPSPQASWRMPQHCTAKALPCSVRISPRAWRRRNSCTPSRASRCAIAVDTAGADTCNACAACCTDSHSAAARKYDNCRNEKSGARNAVSYVCEAVEATFLPRWISGCRHAARSGKFVCHKV